MQKLLSSKGEGAVKLLEQWQYAEYIRYVHSTFTATIVPNDAIKRGKVDGYKEKLISIFENASDATCDSIVGAEPIKELTELFRDSTYNNTNVWGKCALRMAAIIKQVNPKMFFGVSSSNNTDVVTVNNEFMRKTSTRSTARSASTMIPTNSVTTISTNSTDESITHNQVQLHKMKKPQLVQLFMEKYPGDNSYKTKTVATLRENLMDTAGGATNNSSSDTTVETAKVNRGNASTDEMDSSTSSDTEDADTISAARTLSQVMYHIVETSIDIKDISLVLSRYNINPIEFMRGGIHPYYLARMLHAAIIAYKLPSGLVAVQQKFQEVGTLSKVTEDNYEKINALRYDLFHLKHEILVMTNNPNEYAPNAWIQAFLSCIQCASDSATAQAIHKALLDQQLYNMGFEQFVDQIVQHVRIMTSMQGSYIPRIQSTSGVNAVIQVAQTASKIQDRCDFCSQVKVHVYHDINTNHKTEECKRKLWTCRICKKALTDPTTFHKYQDCPENHDDSTLKSWKKERQYGSKQKRRSMSPPANAKRRKYSKDETETSDSESEIDDKKLSRVEVVKKEKLYSNPTSRQSTSMIIDSGANQNILTPLAASSITQQDDQLRISGIGSLQVVSNKSCYIEDMKHYIVDADEGIVSISKICQRYNILVMFTKDSVQFINREQTQIYAEGAVINGLYIMQFEQYCRLLQLLHIREQATVNLVKSYRVSKKCEEYIVLLHQLMGHASADKMTNTIRAGIIIPDPTTFDKTMGNTEVLCQMINRYYMKKICIACKIILHRQILHPPHITVYPTIPFEEVSFDYKPSDVLSFEDHTGTFIAACATTMYAMQFPVKSTKQIIDALKYFVQVANSFGHKIHKIRYDAAGNNDTQEVRHFLNTRGITCIPVAVGRQFRNFVEKLVDKLYKTYNVIQASQCLLSISYWPLGLDTAINYNNCTTNSRCVEKTPHEVVSGLKPRIQQYYYGQPVLINKSKKHFTKEVDYIHQNKLAIVVRIDNTIQYGVKVLSCTSGRISVGNYDMMGTIPYDMHDPVQRKEIQQRFGIQRNIFKLPHQPDSFKFVQMMEQINDANKHQDHIADLHPNTDHLFIHAQQTLEPVTSQIQETQPGEADNKRETEACTINLTTAMNPKITANLLIQRFGDTHTLEDKEYLTLTEQEKNPVWHKTRYNGRRQQWINVAIDELQKLDDNAVGDVVLRNSIPNHIKIIPTTMVLSYKQILQDEGTWGHKPRARLAGRGDLEISALDEECYAPTTYISTILTLLAIAVQDTWIVATFDVIGAFLKTPTSEEIYISLPGDIMSKTYAIKLHKYLYGLRKANSKFNEYFHQILVKYGLTATVTDICLYHNTNMRVAIFVDDGMLITRDEDTRDHFLHYLNQEIGIESHINPQQYLKLELVITPGKILIHQRNYIHQMNIPEPQYSNLHNFMKIQYNDKHAIPSTYEEMRLEYMQSPHRRYVEARQVQEIVGALVYVIYSTRGALQLVGHYLAKHQAAPTEFDLFMAYNTYKHLKTHMYVPLVYTKASEFNLCIISDGAHMKNVDTSVRGQLGWMITLGNCTIMIESKAAARPTRSATETETQAGGNGLAQALYVMAMLQELNVSVHAYHFYTDCLSLIKLINRRQQLSKKARHFANEIAQFKIAVQGPMRLQLFWVPTLQMIVDMLTKLKIPAHKQQEFEEQIMNPSIFYQQYRQHHVNLTYHLFKKVRFWDELVTSEFLEEIAYDNDITYVNEVYHN